MPHPEVYLKRVPSMEELPSNNESKPPFRHSGLDPESRNLILFWTPAFAGATSKRTPRNIIKQIDKTLLMLND